MADVLAEDRAELDASFLRTERRKARRPNSVIEAQGRVVPIDDGKLVVVEFQPGVALDWEPPEWVTVIRKRARRRARVRLDRTTRPGQIDGNQVIRLCLEISSDRLGDGATLLLLSGAQPLQIRLVR